jgi:hypothetical protein
MRYENILGSLSPQPAPARQDFWWWQGASGAWYCHSIIPFSADPPFGTAANYVFVRREFDGRRTGLYIGQADKLRDRMSRHEKLAPARSLGANELHVHLLGTTESERFRIETDLRNGHTTPLNYQGTPMVNALLGIATPRPFGSVAFGLLSELGSGPYRRG